MEEGKKYRIIIKDNDRTREKNLIFKGFKNQLLIFYNETNKKTEEYHPINIIRVEGDNEEGND